MVRNYISLSILKLIKFGVIDDSLAAFNNIMSMETFSFLDDER